MKTSRVIILVLAILFLLLIFICCENNACSKNGEDNTQSHSSGTQENQGENWSQPDSVSCPWDVEGAKMPSEYTWEEYEALSAEQQSAFFEWFPTTEDFDDWLMANEPEPDLGKSQGMPWDDPDALQPKDYSYEQYEALSGDQQVAFIEWFPTTKDFDDWLMANEPELDLGE